MEDVGQGRLDQLPARNALDGAGQLRRQPVELVLHQHSLKGLKESEKGDFRRVVQALCPAWPPAKHSPSGGSVPTQQSLENITLDMNLSWEEVWGWGGEQFVKC